MQLRSVVLFVGLVLNVACGAALRQRSGAQPEPTTTSTLSHLPLPRTRAINSPVASTAPTNATLTEFLTEISDWIMTTGVGSNVLNNVSYFGTLDSIFINGMLCWPVACG